MKPFVSLGAVLGVLLPAVALAKPSAEELDRLPAPASRQVDFNRDIRPILNASCANCHGRGKSKGGFRIDTRETFLADGDSGPAVIVGDSRNSHLIHLVAGLDPDNLMPAKGTRLTAEQVGLLRAWIDQRLPWTAGVSFAREPHRNLQPRQPDLPPAASSEHPVDRLLEPYFAKHGVVPAPPVDDRTFARRVYLDVVGLLPTPAELDEFLRDTRPDKRRQLVRRLLEDSPRYAQHWLTFWNDLLRNDYRGTGYIDGGREQITQWLFTALRDNRSYDQFVRELVDPGEKGPRGFTKGIVWRGAINASQTPPMQAAQNISQVFLGVNLKCASCHDSFIDDWQLSDAYGLAGIYADEKLELVQCDKPLGRHVPVSFVFPELGSFRDDAPRAARVTRLAEIITSRENGRLPRTIVNRFWARLLGHGLVEPLDVMQNPAWHPDLLDWLAEDLVAHGYDLKRTLDLILTSRAYQLPTVDLPEGSINDFVFRGPAVRRLTAEQFRDALAQLTGVGYERPEAGLDSLLTVQGSGTRPAVDAFWIWSDPHAAQGVPPQTVYFRRLIDLPVVPTEAVAFVNADNHHRLWVNGREARRKNDLPWNETSQLDLRPFLRPGTNTFAVEAVNTGDGPNPAGLLFYARLRLSRPGAPASSVQAPESSPEETILDFASDAAWQVSTNRVDGWEKPGFAADGWTRAQTLGAPDVDPWNLGGPFVAAVTGKPVYGNVRAALVASDPLATALGRPNREQVTSVRPSVATTIQMLELTNGETLARVLAEGAKKILEQSPQAPAVIDRIFRQGLGRPATREESSLSMALLGERPQASEVQDLLWSVAMLPEFQLVY